MRTIVVTALAIGPLTTGLLATPAIAAPPGHTAIKPSEPISVSDKSVVVGLGQPRTVKNPLPADQTAPGTARTQRTKKWKSVNGSRMVSAWGTISFNETTSRYTIRGTLKDSRGDGWAAGIDFFIGDAGAPYGIIQPLTLLNRKTRRPSPGPGRVTFTYRAPFGIHAGVRECLVQVKKPYRRKCGRWASIARSGY